METLSDIYDYLISKGVIIQDVEVLGTAEELVSGKCYFFREGDNQTSICQLANIRPYIFGQIKTDSGKPVLVNPDGGGLLGYIGGSFCEDFTEIMKSSGLYVS